MGKKLLTCFMALCLCFSFASCADLFQPVDSTNSSSSVVTPGDSTGSDSSSDSSDSSSDSSDSSSQAPVTEYVTITFQQEGQADVVKTIVKGTTLTEVPTPASKTGYTVVWDETDFTNVTESMTVTAVATAKTYKIILNVGDNATISQTTVMVTYGQAYELPTPSHEDKTFKGWLYNGESFASQGTWELDVAEGELTVTAKWMADWTGSY